MEIIWEKLANGMISQSEAQDYFNDLGEWISNTEKGTPEHILEQNAKQVERLHMVEYAQLSFQHQKTRVLRTRVFN